MRARATASSSTSRIVGLNAPTRSRCVPGASHAPRTIGSVDVVAQQTMSAARTAASSSRTGAAAMPSSASVRARPRPLQARRPHTRTVRPGRSAACARAIHPLKRARAHHEQRARVRPREHARGERRGGRRAPQRERLAIEQRQRFAARAVEHQHRGLHGGRRIGHHRDGLEHDHARVPGRHQQQRVAPGQRVRVAQRHLGAVAEGRFERARERFPGKRCMNVGG